MRVERNKGFYTERKNGSFQVRYPLGWDDVKGRYAEYTEEAASEVEAATALKEINDFIYHGGRPEEIAAFRKKSRISDGNTVTVADFIKEFLSARKKSKRFTARTLESDRECLRRVLPYIGDLPIDRVVTNDIDSMLFAMQGNDADNKNGRTYSGTTALKTYATLNKLFKYAQKKGVVGSNPCVDAEVPKADTAEKEALSLEQIRELHMLIEEDPSVYNVGIAIGLDAGLRLSEMLALTWKDYKDHELVVSKSLEKESQATKKTKNEDTRTIPCGLFLVRVLDRWQELQKRYYAEMDLKWSTTVPIVNSRKGTYITQRNFTRWLEKAREDYACLPDNWGYHGFRHTYITIMNRDAHIDTRTVRELSGHKTDHAFKKYTHTSTEWQREAARRFDALTAPESSTSQVCGSCVHWAQSPSNPAIGACWAKADSGLVVMNADAVCDKDCYEKGVSLQQSLLGYSA